MYGMELSKRLFVIAVLAFLCFAGQRPAWAAPRAGDKAPAFSLKTVDSGDARSLADLTKEKKSQAAVLVFLSCRCPYVAQARQPLADLAKEFGDKVQFVGLNSNQNEPTDEVKADAAQNFRRANPRGVPGRRARRGSLSRRRRRPGRGPARVHRREGHHQDGGARVRLHHQEETVKRAVVPALVLALATAVAGASGDLGRAFAGDRAAAGEPPKLKAAIVDLNGLKAAMSKSRGRMLLVHFWATWCLPCLQELPVLNQFAREMKPRGVDVLSVSLDDPGTAAGTVLRELSQKAPELTATIAKVDDADKFIANFDGAWEGTIPALFAYDVNGKLRGRHMGETTRVQLDRLIKDASRDIPPPAK
jgi:thiol-disulfide isomerase/thioredoxin